MVSEHKNVSFLAFLTDGYVVAYLFVVVLVRLLMSADVIGKSGMVSAV